MKVNIKDERRIDYSVIDITLTKEDIADILRYGFIRTIKLGANYVSIKLDNYKDKPEKVE